MVLLFTIVIAVALDMLLAGGTIWVSQQIWHFDMPFWPVFVGILIVQAVLGLSTRGGTAGDD